MELAAILVLPALAAGVVLLPVGARRFAPFTTLGANLLVLVLALRIAARVGRTGGTVEAVAGLFVCDALGALVLVLVAFVGLTAALFSSGYIGARAVHGEPRKIRRYYALFNLFVLTMLVVPATTDIAVTWVAVSLTTLLSAFLVGFADTPEALEAAWKYIVLTTLGAVLALLGILILYWGTRVAGGGPFTWPGLVAAAAHMPKSLLWSAFLLVLVGFGTKVGLVPMHTWLPDAHSQAPASICALLSGVETTTALYVVLRLFPVLEAAGIGDVRTWFVAFGLISVGVAALVLIHVRDYKRMFAFSTVEHMGIILVAVGLGGDDAIVGAAYQMTAHAIAKSFCFFAAGVTVLAVGTQEIASVRGLIRVSPTASLTLVIGGLAIAGAPPFAIFVSEFAILKAGLAEGQYLTVGLLAFFVVVAFCAVIQHVGSMVFGVPERPVAVALPPACLATLAVAAIPMVVLGLYVPADLQGLFEAAAAVLGGGG